MHFNKLKELILKIFHVNSLMGENIPKILFNINTEIFKPEYCNFLFPMVNFAR